MRRFDLTPLLRSSIGFDDVLRLADSWAGLDESSQAYPPYNIEKLGEDEYRISLAVAGFTPEELDVVVEDRTLTVRGKAADQDEERIFLHQGIAKRAFERTFRLAETVEVRGANFENGLLVIELERQIPEHMKPRQITIRQHGGQRAIGKNKAA